LNNCASLFCSPIMGTEPYQILPGLGTILFCRLRFGQHALKIRPQFFSPPFSPR
jgi:hypothetical protein